MMHPVSLKNLQMILAGRACLQLGYGPVTGLLRTAANDGLDGAVTLDDADLWAALVAYLDENECATTPANARVMAEIQDEGRTGFAGAKARLTTKIGACS